MKKLLATFIENLGFKPKRSESIGCTTNDRFSIDPDVKSIEENDVYIHRETNDVVAVVQDVAFRDTVVHLRPIDPGYHLGKEQVLDLAEFHQLYRRDSLGGFYSPTKLIIEY